MTRSRVRAWVRDHVLLTCIVCIVAVLAPGVAVEGYQINRLQTARIHDLNRHERQRTQDLRAEFQAASAVAEAKSVARCERALTAVHRYVDRLAAPQPIPPGTPADAVARIATANVQRAAIRAAAVSGLSGALCAGP